MRLEGKQSEVCENHAYQSWIGSVVSAVHKNGSRDYGTCVENADDVYPITSRFASLLRLPPLFLAVDANTFLAEGVDAQDTHTLSKSVPHQPWADYYGQVHD